MLDLAPDATVVVDAHGTIVFANAQIEQTFGYKAEEILWLVESGVLSVGFADMVSFTRVSQRLEERALGLDAGGHRGDRGRVVEQRVERNVHAEIGQHSVEKLYAAQRVAAEIEEVIEDSDAGLQQPLP